MSEDIEPEIVVKNKSLVKDSSDDSTIPLSDIITIKFQKKYIPKVHKKSFSIKFIPSFSCFI
jgi:hypothetical protein